MEKIIRDNILDGIYSILRGLNTPELNSIKMDFDQNLTSQHPETTPHRELIRGLLTILSIIPDNIDDDYITESIQTLYDLLD